MPRRSSVVNTTDHATRPPPGHRSRLRTARRPSTLSGVPDTARPSEAFTAASLSTLATQISDLAARAAAAGELLDTPDNEVAAAALFDVERALRGALRATDRARRAL